MALNNARNLKQLYHLTALDNLPSIIKDGLSPRCVLREKGLSFCDIADPQILSKRKESYLDRFIPFHFHPYTAFDYAVKAYNPERKFVYIAIRREFARYCGFKVIPAHPLSSIEDVKLLEYDEGYSQIDWDAITQEGTDPQYARQVKMAECLSDRTIPATLFQNVYVHDEHTKKYVEDLFRSCGITEQPPYVNIMSEWV